MASAAWLLAPFFLRESLPSTRPQGARHHQGDGHPSWERGIGRNGICSSTFLPCVPSPLPPPAWFSWTVTAFLT